MANQNGYFYLGPYGTSRKAWLWLNRKEEGNWYSGYGGQYLDQL